MPWWLRFAVWLRGFGGAQVHPTRAIQLSGVFVPDWVGVALGWALADAGEL
ncbi:hypothetical protein [Nitrosomonas sp. ANs5]|uniref:hypothetical protein n=1 Tax=Nitrosomonas sp. ANs5 TaxID=3423941 RepID=UPI003D34CDB5